MRKSTAFAVVLVVVVLALIAVLGNRQSTAQQTKIPNAIEDVPKVQKWEYQCMLGNADSMYENRDQLRELGKEAWELCEAVNYERITYFYLKRPLK